jgi:hypothetical protein
MENVQNLWPGASHHGQISRSAFQDSIYTLAERTALYIYIYIYFLKVCSTVCAPSLEERPEVHLRLWNVKVDVTGLDPA